MSKDILADIFRHNTAVHVNDIFDDPQFNNSVTVGYCPLVYKDTPSNTSFDLSDPSISDDARVYLEKVSGSLREFIKENAQVLGDRSEQFYNVALAYITDSYSSILEKGHTVGFVFEVTGSVGVGGVWGRIKAYDKNGSSTFGFAGMTAGATAGVAASLGIIYFQGLRSGLQGWGGNFNASVAYGMVGGQWESVLTSGKTGHMGKFAVGAEVALSVEFAKTWLIKSETLK